MKTLSGVLLHLLVAWVTATTAEATAAGTLRITTDHGCRLSIDDQPHGQIEPGHPLLLTLGTGEVFIECQSLRFEALWQRELASVAAGDITPMNLRFGDAVARAEEAEAISQARFEPRDGGYWDAQQALLWAAADNGEHINWDDATDYCAARGAGWQLPTVGQLQSLKRAHAPMKLSGVLMWSRKVAEPDKAFQVSTVGWDWHQERRGRLAISRALCVLESLP